MPNDGKMNLEELDAKMLDKMRTDMLLQGMSAEEINRVTEALNRAVRGEKSTKGEKD